MIGGLATSLMDKFKQKAVKSPPTPPKKDFLDKDTVKSSGAHSDEEPVKPFQLPMQKDTKTALNSTNSSPVTQIPALKPAVKKPFDRSLQPPPPPPPAKPAEEQRPASPAEKAMNKPPPPPAFNLKPVGEAQKPETGKPKPPSLPMKPGADRSGQESAEEANVPRWAAAKKPPDPLSKPSPKPELHAAALKPVLKPPLGSKPNTQAKETIQSDENDSEANKGNVANSLKAMFEARSQEATKKPSKPDIGNKPALKPTFPGNTPETPASEKKPHVPGVPVKPSPGHKPLNANKPSWVKTDSESPIPSTASRTNTSDTPSGKVSDLASVLQAKFNQRRLSQGDMLDDTSNDVPVLPRESPPEVAKASLKPREKPPRPRTPPSPRVTNSHGPSPQRKPPIKSIGQDLGKVLAARRGQSENVENPLDPKKYSARPLPPSPMNEAEEEEGKPVPNRKTLPPVPGKPNPPVTGKPAIRPKTGVLSVESDHSDVDNNSAAGGGLSQLANVLKARLGGAGGQEGHKDEGTKKELPKTPVKPLPAKPGKKADAETIGTDDTNNNSKVADNKYVAICDFAGSNSTEMQLIQGHIYELLNTADGWWYVASDSGEGWAPPDYLKKIGEEGKPEDSPSSSLIGQNSSIQNSKTANSAHNPVFYCSADFLAENDGELGLQSGEEVQVLEQPDGGWWFVKTGNGEGWVPASFLQNA